MLVAVLPVRARLVVKIRSISNRRVLGRILRLPNLFSSWFIIPEVGRQVVGVHRRDHFIQVVFALAQADSLVILRHLDGSTFLYAPILGHCFGYSHRETGTPFRDASCSCHFDPPIYLLLRILEHSVGVFFAYQASLPRGPSVSISGCKKSALFSEATISSRLYLRFSKRMP